jgi:hypothetical protein
MHNGLKNKTQTKNKGKFDRSITNYVTVETLQGPLIGSTGK